MASKRRTKNAPPVSPVTPSAPVPSFYSRYRPQIVAAALLSLVLFFYLTPLFSDAASIQWDAADVHYSLQKYFSDSIQHGKLPVWSPYSFSGMPLIADPEIGAWYPLNWPFFLTGITPRAIEWELALHAAIACLGAWLLALDLLGDMEVSVLAAIFYAFSGFFAAHSSHVGIFQGAALFPWLLWSFRRAVLGNWRRYGAISAAVGACIMLAGHFQTALYCFFALALFAASLRRMKAIPVLAGVMAAVVLLSAATWLPAVELAAESIRAQADFSGQTNSPLVPGALLTLFSPNHYGALEGPYRGPADITQFYFYAGLLLPVLAALGLLNRALRPLAAVMLIPTLWYAFGPSAGLYLLLARLPGFSSVRAPVHIWFVVALIMAILGAAGCQFLAGRFRSRWLVLVLAVFAFGDVYMSNMGGNPLAYARKSFDAAYGSAAAQFDAFTQPVRDVPLHRFWAPADNNLFGPLNGALQSGLEATYGYNPLELQNYSDYMLAARTNDKLLNGLSVTHRIDLRTGGIVSNAAALPRATIPARIVYDGDLASLDPATTTIMQARFGEIHQDPHAKIEITNYEAALYRVRYTAATTSVMRLSVPYFPGWHASIDGSPAPVFVLDHALSGVLVPNGTHELVFQFTLKWLAAALVLSGVSWLVLISAFALAAGPPAFPRTASPKPEPVPDPPSR